MFIRSIRFKIILWYMLILGATLSIFSIIVYHNFKGNLYEDTDDLLQSKAEGIAKSIDTYWETEKLDAIREGAPRDVFNKSGNLNFARIAQHWVEERSADTRLMNITVQINDNNGKPIVIEKNAPYAINLPMDKLKSSLAGGESRFDNIKVKLQDAKLIPLRLFTMPAVENNKVAYIVQVAEPLDQAYSTLDNLKMPLLIILPITVFITGVAGAFLVKLTLNPVNAMIKTIHQITAENLSMRVDIPDTKDEIKKLADTFNDMLSKLDQAFTGERKFIQDVSHELKTPLTILKGELEVTLKKTRPPQEYESVLRSSLEEIDRISKIVNDLLTLARLDSGETPFNAQALDLNLLLKNTVEDIDILAQQKQVKINILTKEKITLIGDEKCLKRLFLNLLDNAVKYTPESGAVSLSLNKNEFGAKIEITDTGIGISSEDLPHIFSRFYRARGIKNSSGFGLGLAIAKSIVDLHNGRIEVKSQLNRGTVFSVFLPLAPQ